MQMKVEKKSVCQYLDKIKFKTKTNKRQNSQEYKALPNRKPVGLKSWPAPGRN